MKTFKINFLILALLLIASCNYRIDKQNPNVTTQDAPVVYKSADELTYKIIADNVFTKNCVGCHSVSGGNKGSVNLENFENVLKNIDDIRTEVSGKTMPPRKQLSAEQIKIVLAWIDAGANENGKVPAPVVTPPTPVTPTPPPVTPDPVPPVTTPTPDPTPVVVIPADPKEITYAMVNSVLFEPKCLKCHSEAGGNKGDTNLETYKNVFDNLKDIYDDIKAGDMPRGKDKVLTAQQLKIFFDWYDAGATENGTATTLPDTSTNPAPGEVSTK